MLPNFVNREKYQYSIICVACLICYGCSLNGSEFVFDDSVAIVNNEDVVNKRSLMSDIFKHDFWGYNITDKTSHKSYRPLTIIWFRLEYMVYDGLNPVLMKCVNLVLHTAISCGLLSFYKSFLSDKSTCVPFYGAFLFAIHPVHTEAVSGIVGRAELGVALLFLLSFATYFRILKVKNHVWGLWTILISIAGISILFKENGITILPILIVYDLIRLTDTYRDIFTSIRISFMRTIGLLTTTLVLIYMRMHLMNFKSPTFKKMDNPLAAHESFIVRALNQNYLYSLNAWILLCPEWLSFDWALGSIPLIETFDDIRNYTILIFYSFVFLLVYFGSKNVRLAFCFIVISFLPASGIIRLGFVVAERVLYLPSIGFCLLIAMGIKKLQEKLETRLVMIALYALIGIFISKTIVRAREWRTEDTLFKSAILVCPNNAKVYYNIARLSTDRNEKATAFKYYHKAISLYPQYESAIMNLGNLYREMGDYRMAEKYLKQSIGFLEEFPAAWMNLGIVQASLKKYAESLRSYEKALKYRKRYPVCLYNLGNLYIEMKNETMALKYWRESIRLDPKQSKAWANILALIDNKHSAEDVIRISETALSFIPNDPAIMFTRANAYGKLGNFIESERIFKEIIELRPRYALYYANLGVLYHRWQKIQEAKKYYLMALQLDPHLKSAQDNLIKLKDKF